MPLNKLREFLDDNRIKYVSIRHSPAFTAQEIAASAHIPGKEVAKTVMVKLDGAMHMAVLPASSRVDFSMLRRETGAKRVELAQEQEFLRAFPGCELGAMPPFGNLFGMQVFLSAELTEDEEIAFNAGSHTELLRLSLNDFVRVVKPRISRFAAAGHPISAAS